METNQEKQAVAGLQVSTSQRFTIPTEELKEFYFKEAILMDPLGCNPNRSEFELLCILEGHLRKEVNLLSQLNTFNCKDAITTLQTIIGNYLTQDTISRSERMKMNKEFTQTIHFLILIATNKSVISMLLKMFMDQPEQVKLLHQQYLKEEKGRMQAKD